MSSFTTNRGATLIEVIIVTVIAICLATIVTLGFSSFRAQQGLSNTVDESLALLSEARSRTLAGEGGLAYGVHFETNRIVLFTGATFSEGVTGNKIVPFDSTVQISSISLAGGTTDVLFQKLSGATDQSGTITIAKTDTPSETKTITISKLGTASSN